MCGEIRTIKSPETELASLMEREIGCGGYVDPKALRLFLLAYWGRVSTLAHAIHNSRDNSC